MGIFQKLEVNYLIAPKILYFMTNLQYYTIHQFRPAFAREKFLVSQSQYGRFTGIIMFITFFTNILIGGVSDKTKKPKAVLMFLTMITGAIFMGFYFNPLMSISIYMFWGFMLLYLAFNNPKQPLLDKIMLDYLSDLPSVGPQVYGKQRLWGTVAYGAATYLCEWCLVEGSGKNKQYNFNNLIYYNLITTALSALVVSFLIKGKSNPAQSQDSEEKLQENEPQDLQQNQETNSSPIKDYLNLLADKEYLFFILIIFSNAVTRSAMSIYLTIYHREVLNVQPYDLPDSWPGWFKGLLGIFNEKPITTITFFGIAFEVIVMFISAGIIDKLGLFLPLLLAQLFSLIRFAAYYVLSEDSKHVYGYSCIFEFIKGIYFGLAHISAVQIATKLAPPNLKATSQMIYQGTFTALGSLVSGVVFSLLFDAKLKGDNEENKGDVFRTLFLTNGVVSCATILLYIYKYGIKDKVLFSRDKEEEKLNEAQIKHASQTAPPSSVPVK